MPTSNLLKQLDNHFADRSYVEGYQPSQADLQALDTIKTSPTAETPHVLRWYNHIKSFNNEEKKKFLKGVLNSEMSKILSNSCAKPDKSAEDDDDVDLFGSEEEDEEAERIKQERVKAYTEKKSKKQAVIAKSSIVLDVKPWDDETDMKAMEKNVRSLQMDGLVWGASKLVPVGYGINKLQIMCVVEDDKVSVDDLAEKIQEFEDFVQSVDVAAFNKV